MKTLTLAGFLLAFAFTSAAFAQRGGFERGGGGGGGGQQHSEPAGGGSFHPAGGGEIRHAEPQGGGARIPIERPQAFQRPVIESPHAPPVAPGRANILPSVNAANRVIVPRAVQPAPAQRPGGERDFLGFRSEHPENRPGIPNRSNPVINPGVAGRPAFSAGRIVLPPAPGRPERSVRPPLPGRWQNAGNNFNGQFNRWQQASAAGIAAFQGSRGERWNQIQQRANDRNWPRQFRSPAYQDWRRNVWNFRKDRAAEVWAATRDLHENLFDNHWWGTAWWRHNGFAGSADASPWWWWNGANWADTSAFFGSTIGPEPIPFDPGTNASYDGDSFVLNGQDDGTSADENQQADALAGPPVDNDNIPVPEPPADGQPAEWLSLGAWALTQQEQGDPVMFFQISVNKDGIVAGGYKNALTGDEQPIVGRLDRRSQRVAWHINNTPQTVFETGLSDLNYDVASVFVHFGGAQTQTWLLVRLPSPATPPSAVNVPAGS